MADISLILQDDCFIDPDDGGDPSDGEGRDNDISGSQQDEESLTPIAKLEMYAQSENIFNRQMVPSILLEIFRDASAESLTSDLPALMDVIARIADDNETSIRTDLVQRIPHLAAACVEYGHRVPALSSVVVDHLLPLVVKYLGDPDNQVRKTTHTTLLTLMEQGLVARYAIETQVCPKVLHYTYADSAMDYHTSAVALMSKMVPLLGKETTERLFLQRFSELCSNPVFYVRKICASSFGEFCAVVGKDAYENILLPRFIELCADEIWGVRKACAEVVMTVSCGCSPESRRTRLAPAFAKLLQDQSRWVRMSAFQTLGPFISTFADPSIIGLTYNQFGELVLINPAGTEFRINSPAFTDVNLKANADFKQRFHQAQERNMNKNHLSQPSSLDRYDQLSDFWNNCYTDNNKTDNNLVFDEKQDNNSRHSSSANQLNNDDDYDVGGDHHSITADELFGPSKYKPETKQFQLDNDDDKENNPVFAEEKEDQHDEAKCKSDCGDNNTNVVDDDSSSFDLNNCDDSNDEIIDHLADDLTTKVHLEQTNSSSSDNNNETTDVIDKIQTTTTEDSSSSSSRKGNDEDDLNKFNLYQYWYLSPDMPLDPDIVGSCGSPKKSSSVDEKNFMSRLDDIRFNCSWNPSADDTTTLVLNRTKLSYSVEEPAAGCPPMAAEIRLEYSGPMQQIVPQLLIDHFISMTDPGLAANTDNEMAYHCAFSLPAVALTLGRNNWFLLKKTCELLASDLQYKIRKILASSLHELALILGQEMAAEHLLPIFNGFIKDLDEVRIGVLKHLAHFLKLIGPDKRNLYLPRLAEFLQTDNEWNWRFREELANQLLMAVPLFQPFDASKHIAMLAQELLCDKVFAVRQVAISLVTELVRHISSDANLTSWLLLKLAEEFAHSKRWVRRQAFALLCSRLISKHALPPEQFARIVMPHLLDLSWDPVPNVRLAVSRTLARDIIVHDYFADEDCEQYEPVHTVLRRLQSDKDRDVRQYAIPPMH